MTDKVLFPISFSAYNLFDKCPAAYHFRYIQKSKQADSPATLKGTEWHANIEEFIKSRGQTCLIPELKQWRYNLKALAMDKAEHIFDVGIEQRICVDKDNRAVPWFDKTGLFAIIIDAWTYNPRSKILTIIDFKTGEVYDSHIPQIEFYIAVLTRLLLKEYSINIVRGERWYLDACTIKTIVYMKNAALGLYEDWIERANTASSETEFKETPSFKSCLWCPYRADRPNVKTMPQYFCDEYWRKKPWQATQ